MSTHPLAYHFDAYPALNLRGADAVLRQVMIAAIEDALQARDATVEDVDDVRWHGFNLYDEFNKESALGFELTVVLLGYARHGKGDFYIRQGMHESDGPDIVHHYTGPLAAA